LQLVSKEIIRQTTENVMNPPQGL